MSEQSSGPERPVRETPRAGQQCLFAPSAVPPGEGEESTDTGERRFVEKNPQEITVGGMQLGRYLKERDQEWILVMRERLRAVDWSSWEARYDGGGRPPYHPAPMVGLVIYGVMDGKGSLRELEELAVKDLGCMWLTGGIQPDHATIGRFICRHDEQLKEEGFLELTESILEVMPHVDREVAGDGTILEAFASRTCGSCDDLHSYKPLFRTAGGLAGLAFRHANLTRGTRCPGDLREPRPKEPQPQTLLSRRPR